MRSLNYRADNLMTDSHRMTRLLNEYFHSVFNITVDSDNVNTDNINNNGATSSAAAGG